MIITKVTKNAVGMTLFGDRFDLNFLYDVIHALSTPLKDERRQFDMLMNFASDVRQASRGGHETQLFNTPEFDHADKKTEYYAVNIHLPLFLVYTGMLRQCASYMPTTREHQGMLYLLESEVGRALQEYDEIIGTTCYHWLLYGFPWFEPEYVIEYIFECTHRYTYDKKVKDRFSGLPELLTGLYSTSQSYQDYKAAMEQDAKAAECTPNELTTVREWPEITW